MSPRTYKAKYVNKYISKCALIKRQKKYSIIQCQTKQKVETYFQYESYIVIFFRINIVLLLL